MDDDLAGQLNEEIGEDVPLHNTKDPDEVFLTNKSRLRLALLEYKDGVQSLKAWVNPFVLLVTVGSILLVSDFQQTFGLPGEFWLALYSLIGIVGFVWLLYSIRQYFKNKDKAKIETVIGELKRSE